MPKPQCHIAIVGAGLGGLAAAIGIAKAGHKVTVIEQAAVLGEVLQELFLPLTHKQLQASQWEKQSSSCRRL